MSPDWERIPLLVKSALTSRVAPLAIDRVAPDSITTELHVAVPLEIAGEFPVEGIVQLTVEVGTPSLQSDDVAQSVLVDPVHVVSVVERIVRLPRLKGNDVEVEME